MKGRHDECPPQIMCKMAAADVTCPVSSDHV
jgi:hypothetical protein